MISLTQPDPSLCTREQVQAYFDNTLVDRYLHLHYAAPDNDLDPLLRHGMGFPARMATRTVLAAQANGVHFGRVLDVGCAVGGVSFALSAHFAEVVGVDNSDRFIDTAWELARRGRHNYEVIESGDDRTTMTAVVSPYAHRDRVRFEVADVTRLDAELGVFDVVVVSDVLCRLRQPRDFVARLTDLVEPGGLIVFATPWSWGIEHTPRPEWIDGFDELAACLSAEHELVSRSTETTTLRLHARRYEVIFPELTVWRRRPAQS